VRVREEEGESEKASLGLLGKDGKDHRAGVYEVSELFSLLPCGLHKQVEACGYQGAMAVNA
jgi:hypothetical protein